jgi:hypothetical protein
MEKYNLDKKERQGEKYAQTPTKLTLFSQVKSCWQVEAIIGAATALILARTHSFFFFSRGCQHCYWPARFEQTCQV